MVTRGHFRACGNFLKIQILGYHAQHLRQLQRPDTAITCVFLMQPESTDPLAQLSTHTNEIIKTPLLL